MELNSKVISEAGDELLKGIKVEMEHKTTYNAVAAIVKATGKMPDERTFFMLIAVDHIMENRQYYSLLAKLGL